MLQDMTWNPDSSELAAIQDAVRDAADAGAGQSRDQVTSLLDRFLARRAVTLPEPYYSQIVERICAGEARVRLEV